MSFRTTAILAALLAVLGGIFYFTEVRGGRRDPDEAKRLFTAKAADVESLELRAPKGEIALRREGDGWRMERPLAVKGDQGAIAGLLAVLVNAKADRTLEEPPKNPADFGLDKPELTVRFRVKGDAAWRRLEFGGKNPTGAWAYVRKDDGPLVALVPETLRAELNKSPLDLRDKSVMDVAADRVERLVVHRGGQVAVELQKGQHWELVRPVKARADDWRASGLVRQAAELKAKEFAAEPATDLKAFGLDRPTVRLELWEKEAKAPKVLALAEVKDKKDALYARHEGSLTVAVVDRTILSDVPSGPWEIRDKSLFHYANQDVKRVRLAGADKAVAVEREGETRWKVVEPAPGPADERKVTDLLFKLTALRVDGLAAERPDRLDTYGLEKPQLTITITRTDGREEGTLLVGKEEGEKRYVHLTGEAPVYTIAAKDLKDLPRTPADFVEKKPEKKA
jgi:hypothetical protein